MTDYTDHRAEGAAQAREQEHRAPSAGQLLTVDQAAEILDCSTKTIRNRIRNGDLPAQRFGARLIRIRLDDLERLMRPIPHTEGPAEEEPAGPRIIRHRDAITGQYVDADEAAARPETTVRETRKP